MDENELAQIRDTLLGSLDDQYKADTEAENTQYRVNQQQLMYNNDRNGTLYSGLPTWQRAQLAANHTSDLANLGNTYLGKKLDIWNNIQNTLDQINSYNKAADAMAKATQNVSATTGNATTGTSLLDLYESLQGGK